jgi:hypothetical protein
MRNLQESPLVRQDRIAEYIAAWTAFDTKGEPVVGGEIHFETTKGRPGAEWTKIKRGLQLEHGDAIRIELNAPIRAAGERSLLN